MTNADERSEHQRTGHDGCNSQNCPRANLLQDCRSDESPDHGAQPVERNVFRSRQLTNVADVRLAEVVDQETANGDFRSHVNENSNHAEHELPKPPEALERAP